jgi:glycosyltransferase involved in cell wall biosynthesis
VTATPLISIITPTYNQGRFIEYTIKSLLAQSFTDFEHIVIDGGSTDDTLDILRDYGPRYRLRWVSGRDAGMYDAINKGLAMADGDIHAYLNSDDLYLPWTLELVASAFATRHDRAIVFGDTVNIDDTTGRQYVRIFPAAHMNQLVKVMPLPQPAVFWAREVTLGLKGFRPDLQYVGDWDFFLRASGKFHFYKIDEFLAIERRHDASKTVGEARPMAMETARMLDWHRDPSLSGPDATLLKVRALAARRATWVRFLRAASLGGHLEGEPWSQMLTSRRVTIALPRLLAGFIPGVPYRWKAGAITTSRDWLRPE